MPRLLARLDRLGVWPARLAWLGVPLAIGPALTGAMSTTSTPVRWVTAIVVWLVWAGVLVGLLVPTTLGLTAVRVAAPAAFAAALWAALVGSPDTGDGVALAWAALACVTAFAAFTADAFVDGSSYGDETRFALRAPIGVVVVAVAAWVVVVSGVAIGPLLLAGRQWVAGGVAVAVGFPAAWFAVRRLHQLARRWLVLVPAGIVVHDPLLLPDPVLFPGPTVRALAPATRGDAGMPGVVDLSATTPGLALALRLRQPVKVGRGDVEADLVLFTPGRPGALLAEARRRRFPRQ
ncbi:MAG: hypothetical protein ACRD0U_11195 [Acidimicrobiales bacterium]